MKRFRGCLRIALDELRTQRHFYLVFLLSASVFFATLISIMLVTVRIPAVLDEEFADSHINVIEMSKIPDGFLSTLEEMPVKIIDFPIMKSDLIGIDGSDPENRYYTEEHPEAESGEILTRYYDMFGRTGNVVADKPNDHITRLNEALLIGEPWTKEDNTDNKIWLCEKAAELTGYRVGDVMHFPGKLNTDVTATVAGIYKRDDPEMNFYYITFSIYESVIPKMVENNRTLIRPDSILQHNKVINEIKSYYYYAFSYSKSVIDGYMALLFLLFVLCGFIGLMVVGILFATARAYFARRTRFFSVLKALGFRNRGVLTVVCLVTQGVLTVAFLVSQLLSPFLLAYVSDCLSDLYFEMNISTNVWNGTALCGFIAVSALAWIVCFIGKRTFKTAEITELMRSESQ
jgi:predicted lysophospholipase L1 biosynthesis ABC-type transport system permease subunit